MKTYRLLSFVYLSLIAFCCFSFTLEAKQANNISQFLLKKGDNDLWKSTSFDDSNWDNIYQGLPKEAGIYWSRLHVHVSKQSSMEQQTLFTSILGSYDIYWDGYWLSSNGIVGDSMTSEVPGNIDKITTIPNYLWTEGDHVISIRISNFHSPDKLRTRTFMARFDSGPISNSLLPFMVLGGFIILSLYFFQLYIIFSPQNIYLIFSLLCLSVSGLLIAETWRNLIGYSYDWHQFRLISVGILTFVVATLLPLYFLFQFSIKHKFRWMVCLIASLGFIGVFFPTFDIKNLYMLLTAFVFSLIITIIAIRSKQQGSRVACVAISTITITLLVMSFSFLEEYFFPMFAIFICIELTYLTKIMTSTEHDKNLALLNSAQLEISLLRKNIQPHFILNTLTSIEEWIEESPKTAILFIDALADEFRVLNNMSDKKLIPLAQEIDLCNSHLEIMSYRKDQKYVLNIKDIDLSQKIPPAILHTLIENSLTHNRYTSDTTIFNLQQINNLEDNTIELQLSTPISQNGHNKIVGTGTGLKYIRSRLTESFQDRWHFEEQALGDFWISKVRIPKSN
ncbi:MAG: histidine kinase [Alteromonadaceae bacterium]|nr:histidine kinase [Alteromonadaceae bacterium]